MAIDILTDVVEGFSHKQVLLAGDVMLDQYICGVVQRVSPEAPVPVVCMGSHEFAAGGAANTAANVVQLGGRVCLGAVVGRDEASKLLENVCRRAGIQTAGLLNDRQRSTTTKSRVVGNGQQIVRVDREDKAPISVELEDRLLDWCRQSVPAAHVCVLSDYDKGVVTARVAQRMICIAHLARRPVVVDPKGTDWRKYRGATVIKPNVLELQHFLGHRLGGPAAWRWAGNALADLLPGTSVVVSCGAEGMKLLMPGRQPLHIHAAAQEVFDVTGAGDTVIAVLALALAAGASIEIAAHLANYAAGVVVGKSGTATVTRRELLNGLYRARNSSRVTFRHNGDGRCNTSARF